MNLRNNPELLPLIEWWEKEGKQCLIWVAVAALAVAGYYGFKNHRAAKKAAASAAIVNSNTMPELEAAVATYGDASVGPALRQRLAKSYFDEGKFQEALSLYEQLAAKPAEGFADVPVVGKAQCLEALGKFAEAGQAFDAFAEANPTNYLKLTAQLGAARCIVAGGDAKKALARIEALKVAYKDDKAATARVEATEDFVKRFGQKADPAPIAPEVKVEAKPEVKVEAKPEVKVEVKAAEKPAEKPAAK